MFTRSTVRCHESSNAWRTGGDSPGWQRVCDVGSPVFVCGSTYVGVYVMRVTTKGPPCWVTVTWRIIPSRVCGVSQHGACLARKLPRPYTTYLPPICSMG